MYKKIIPYLISSTLILSLYRLTLFVLNFEHFQNFAVLDIAHAFLTGMRFDILILGFTLIPAFLLFFLFSLLGWNVIFFWIIKIYLILSWSVINILSLWDSYYFSIVTTHMYNPLDLSFNFLVPEMYVMQNSLLMRIALYIWHAFWFSVGLKYIWNISKPLVIKNWNLRTLFGWFPHFAAFILLAFMCRGLTLAPRHLAREHCEWTQAHQLQELCLNPHWTFNKVKNEIVAE